MNPNFFVSVIIPCRDEEKFIRKCLDSLIVQNYPKDKLEVLIVDGMSEDRSREIIKRYTEQCSFIKLLDNPKKITPVALNIGIKHARGEVIVRMDAHATYEKDYIAKCVKYLEEYNADNVGGVMITLPRNNTVIGKAIAAALSHPFGVGSSFFRTGSKKPKWVDTIFGGCYRREVFEKIGLFNENLVRSQDMEFNLRLKNADGKILLHPEIISYYYAPSKFKIFCKHTFVKGIWVVYPFKFVSHMPVSLRHLIPLVFVLSLAGSGGLSVFSPVFLWLFLFIIGSYAVFNIFFSSRMAFKEREIKYLFLMPFIFASFHISYGLGSLWGLIKISLSKQFWGNLRSILMSG